MRLLPTLLLLLPCLAAAQHTLLGGTMQYKVPESVPTCSNLQLCPVELTLRVHVASGGSILSGTAPDWGTISNGDGSSTSVSSLTIQHVVTNSVNSYDTYEMTWAHNYSSSTTFALACQNQDSSCYFDVVFRANANLQTVACTAVSGDDTTCHLNAGGDDHTMNMRIYDLSRNLGSPVIVVPGVQSVFRSDDSEADFSIHMNLIDQADTRIVRNALILENSNLPTWATFNENLTSPWNVNEWEYTTTEVLDTALDSTTPNVETTVVFTTSSNIDDDDNTYYNSNVNLTTTTYSVSSTGTSPKITVEQTVVYDYVGCFAAATWTEFDFQSEEERIFPVCVNESNAWVRVGNTNTASSTGNAPQCPEIADVEGDSITDIGFFRCTIPSASSRVSYYGAMKNQAGDGVATSPSVNVMNSQGEWQFSSQGADAETEFETVIYASETDSTTYRILDEGQFMSIVSAEDAQGSKVESFWTLRVTDRPKVCENAPATACTTSSDCSSGACSDLVSSSVISAGPDANMVRSQCLIEFDVVARSQGNFAAPSGIFAHHLPVGASISNCQAENSNDLRCKFSWDVPSDVSGDFRVCFAAVDGGKYEGEDTFCQSIRVIGADVETNLLRLTLPQYGDIQICANRSLFWYDAVVELGNSNVMTLSECDASGANCVAFASNLASADHCKSSGLCTYDWNVGERTDIGNVTIRVESTIIDSTCQSAASELITLVKRPAPYNILSPGGQYCGDSNWYKGCTADADDGENIFSLSVFGTTVDIDVDVCNADQTNCFSIQAGKTYDAGNHKEHVNITSADTAIYAFLQDETEYVARLRTQCYADVTTSFLVKRRGNTYLDVALSKNDTWYGCRDYTATVSTKDEKNVGAVTLTRTGASSGLIDTTSLTYTGSNVATFSDIDENTALEDVTFTATATSIDADCVPVNDQVTYTVSAYPSDTIQLLSPPTLSLSTCVDTTITGDWKDELSSLNLGAIKWSIVNSTGESRGSSATDTTVRPTQSDVGDTWTLTMLPSSTTLEPCMSPGYDFALTIESGDAPLTFSESTPKDWYPCTNVTISWSSSYPDYVQGNVPVDLTLEGSTGSPLTLVSNTNENSFVYTIPEDAQSGSYTLRASSSVGECMSDATAAITLHSWAENGISITNYPSNGLYRCNTFDFTWSAVTTASSLDVCICKDCDTSTGPQNCYAQESDTLNLNIPLNTLSDAPTGTNYIFVEPASDVIATCAGGASQSFEMSHPEVSMAIESAVWNPYCSYNVNWSFPFEVGPLRVELCVDSNCTSADYNTVLLNATTNPNVQVIADPASINGWDGMSESSNVMVRVVAVDFEASIYDGCNYSAYSFVRILAKEELSQDDCRDTSNSAYVPPPPASIPWNILIPAAVGIVLVVGIAIYYVYYKGKRAAQKEEHALELSSFAMNRYHQKQNANQMALETTRMSMGDNVKTRNDMNDARSAELQEKLDRLEKKLKKAKIVQEQLDRDDDGFDTIGMKRGGDEDGFAAELMSDL